MTNRIDNLIIYLFCFSGIILPFAIKGFTILFILTSLLALVRLVQAHTINYQFDWQSLFWAWIFLGYISASYFWSATPDDSGTALIKVLAFVAGLIPLLLWQANTNITATPLKYALIIGIALTFISGLWHYLPTLQNTTQLVWGDISLEPTRQVNRALGIASVLIFITALYYRHRPRLTALILLVALTIALASQSQSAALAMVLGVIVFYIPRFAYALMIAGFIGGILLSVPIAKYSFTNATINNLVPAKLNEAASINIRRYIYYVYANDIKEHILFGRGINSDRNYISPHNATYLETAQTLPHMSSLYPYLAKSQEGVVAQHPHQIFLQIIFNFGYIGGVLFLLGIIQGLRLLHRHTHPAYHRYYLAAIAAYVGQFLFGYSLWQSWMIASSFIIIIIALLLHKPPQHI